MVNLTLPDYPLFSFPHFWRGYWYLEALFVFSIVFLPLLWWLKQPLGQRVLAGLGNLLAKPGAIYLLALPIIFLIALPDPNNLWTGHNWGGWSLLGYIPFFLYGYVLVAHEGVQTSIRHLRWISLVCGVVLTSVMLVLYQNNGDPQYGTTTYTVLFSLFGLDAWCLVLAVLGFGMDHLSFRTPLLDYANEAVLPFYVLHQTILLCVGYFLVGSSLPDLAKAIVISTSSFAIIMLLYEYAIRRNNVLRFLFGMKPHRTTQAAILPVKNAQPIHQ